MMKWLKKLLHCWNKRKFYQLLSNVCWIKKYIIFLFFVLNCFFLNHFIWLKDEPQSRNSFISSFYNYRNENNCLQLEWSKISNQIIDISIALASIDLPPYVLLEIIDWLPLFEYVDHKKKIDLIINLKKSISKIFENKK